MAYYQVEPEVAGELGPHSVVDTSVHPPVVSRLEYVFTDWLGDCILETFPCYIVTDDAAAAISAAGLTGVAFDDVTVSLSDEAEELIDRDLPAWKWLKVTGQPLATDFAISDDHRLVISDRARDILAQGGISNADIEEA